MGSSQLGSDKAYPSDLELLEWFKYYKGRIIDIYENNPPKWLRRVLSFEDGSAGEFINRYDYPAEDKVQEMLQQEYKRLYREVGEISLVNTYFEGQQAREKRGQGSTKNHVKNDLLGLAEESISRYRK